MRPHSAICAICLLLSISCLVSAYMLTGYWLIWLSIPAMMVLWMATRRWSAFWPTSSLLAVYILLAVAGVALKVPPLLMVVGCIFALVAWDLSDLRESMVGDSDPGPRASLARRRLQALALMSGISLFLAAASPWLGLRLPFGAIVLLVLLVAGCLMYSVRHLGSSAVELG